MKASKRSRKDARGSKLKEDEDISLDAGVWGKLQDYISLQNVYEKLSNQELFRLRFVCKAWNHAALQTLEPKPYFVVIAQGVNEVYKDVYLNGVLSYDVASEKYTFKRQRFPIRCSYPRDVPFEVEGLIFCHHPENLEQQGVFNIHNKMWHAIPPAPEKSEYRSAIGMIVDTSIRPYTFKLVVGSLDRKTQIYDSQSRSWSTTSSRLKQLAKQALSGLEIVTCMCSNGCVYISIGAEILLMYSIEEDKWAIMDSPEVKQEEEGGGGVHALGEWEGRIFTTREDCGKKNVTVWELVDRTKEKWVKSVIISKKDYSGLMDCDFAHYGPSIYEELRLMPCFCDGYLLIYNWHYSRCQSYALGVLNLATNEWERVYVPPRTVAIERAEEDSEMEEGSDDEEGSEEGYDFEDGDEGEDAVEVDDSESEASDPGCAAEAIRVRRETGCSTVKFQRQIDCSKTKWEIAQRDIVRSQLARRRKIDRERDLAMQLALRKSAELLSIPTMYVPRKEIQLPSITGKIVKKPTLAEITENSEDCYESTSSSWREAKMRNPAGKAEKPSSTIGKIVVKPTLGKFECAMCGFNSDAPADYEAHKKRKVHSFLEELRKDQRQQHQTPLSLMHQYVTCNCLQVNYEIKLGTCAGSFEVIAIVQGAADGTAGPPTKGFGTSHRKKQQAKQMAAADALERIMENVSESEFANLVKTCFVVGARKRKGGGGGNTGGSGNSGVGVGVGGNPGGNTGSFVGVGGDGGGNPGGSGVGVGGGVEGIPGGYSGNGVGIGDSGGGGGNLVDNEGSRVGGGGGGDSSGSGEGVREGGGKPRGNGSSSRGVGGGGGNYSRNPNAIPVTGYNNDSPRAGSLNSNLNKYAGRGGTGYNMSWQGGRGRMSTHPEIYTERKLQNLTKSYFDGIRGGRGYGGDAYGRREPSGGVGVGGNSYGGQNVGGIGYIHGELPVVLGYGGRELRPGTSAYGQQAQVSPVPHNIGQQISLLSRSQHVPAQHISIQHVQTQHALTQQAHTQQATMRSTMVGGPGQGGTPYSIYDSAPQSTVGVATAPEQTATHTYSHQYAPSAFNYGAYAINQEYVVNSAVPVQEVAPRTSNVIQSAFGAHYGMIHPQQQVPQQRVVYALQGATQHQS